MQVSHACPCDSMQEEPLDTPCPAEPPPAGGGSGPLLLMLALLLVATAVARCCMLNTV